jgi:NADPH-dependent F420 reductase
VADHADEANRAGSSTDLATIALIGGTGKLGPALAARFARAGHPVVIGSRDAARAEQAAATVTAASGAGGTLVRGADNATAAAAADIVVITVPFDAQDATLRGLAAAVAERIVVSTAVPLRMDAGAATYVDVEQGSASEQVAALLPRARVVGALHTVSSVTLAKLDRRLDADVVVTGDDPDAKAAVAQLLAALPGIRVVDGGPLRNSRYIEQLTVLLLSINMRVRRNTGIRITNLPDELAMPTAPSPPPRSP